MTEQVVGPAAPDHRPFARRRLPVPALVLVLATVSLYAIRSPSPEPDEQVLPLTAPAAPPAPVLSWERLVLASRAPAAAVGFDAEGRPLLVASGQEGEALWRVKPSGVWRRSRGPAGLAPRAVAAAGDAVAVLGRAEGGDVLALSADGGTSWTMRKLPAIDARTLAVREGEVLIGGTSGGRAGLWRLREGTLEAMEFRVTPPLPSAVEALSADGVVAVGTAGEGAGVWRLSGRVWKPLPVDEEGPVLGLDHVERRGVRETVVAAGEQRWVMRRFGDWERAEPAPPPPSTPGDRLTAVAPGLAGGETAGGLTVVWVAGD